MSTTWALIALFYSARGGIAAIKTDEVYFDHAGCALAASSATLLAKADGKSDLVLPSYACIPVQVKEEGKR